jgi:AcrR family transcriptional regulator
VENSPEPRPGRKPVADTAAIVRAAWEQFEVSGFEATTMMAVALKSGVSRRTLFNHFGSKEALLFPGLEQYMRDFARVLSSRPASEPILVAMQYVLRELSASTVAIELAFPSGPAVRQARLRLESVKFAHDQFARWMNDAIILWLGDSAQTRVKAGLVSALAAQVWSEMARIQAASHVSMDEALDATMSAVRELLAPNS